MKEKRKATTSTDLNVPALDLTQLERILSFMGQHGLEEFEYCRADLRVRLKKATSNSAAYHSRSAPPEIIIATPTPAQVSEASAAVPPRSVADESGPVEDLHLVKSPIVGTYYEAPSPDTEPFVKEGDHVEVGHVLCIIEAMKLMNEIESDVAGEVVRILVQNGQPVEYGEPLFALRSTRKK